MKRVAIFGGGVAGLTAAHELAERGFAVTVFESRQVLGGKARSIGVPGSGQGGLRELPGEHGFRFFPRFYRHIRDTMQRIPYGRNRRGVLDNLTDTTRIGATRPGKRTMVNAARFPRSLDDLRTIGRVVRDNDFDLTTSDMIRGLELFWRLATMCDERRLAELDQLAWADWAQARLGSPGYKYLIGTPQLFVALRAEEISARTTGSIALQMMLALATPGCSSDQVLSGPTSDVWIDPWCDHLRRLGVTFRLGATVSSLHTDGSRLCSATICEHGRTLPITADWYVAALPIDVMATLISPSIGQLDPQLGRLPALVQHTRWMVGMQFFLRTVPELIHGHYIHLESPWALTSVMHQQFWPRDYLRHFGDGTTTAVLSVDISDWDTPGRNGKPARACTEQELRTEIWQQLCESLNIEGRQVLQPQDLQAVYLCPSLCPAGPRATATYSESLFVNAIGTGTLRPTAGTDLDNLLLAGDYVRTGIDLACMEGANEAARRAVNALLRRSGDKAMPCQVWPLKEPTLLRGLRALDAVAFRKGQPWPFGKRQTDRTPSPWQGAAPMPPTEPDQQVPGPPASFHPDGSPPKLDPTATLAPSPSSASGLH